MPPFPLDMFAAAVCGGLVGASIVMWGPRPGIAYVENTMNAIDEELGQEKLKILKLQDKVIDLEKRIEDPRKVSPSGWTYNK